MITYSAPDAYDQLSRNSFFFAFLHKYSLFIGSLERFDRAESVINRTFEKKYFLVKLWRKEKIGFWGSNMATWHDGTFDVNMTSLEVVRTRNHIRRFLRRSLLLKIKPNTGQMLGTTDKIERRKIWPSLKGGPFWLMILWRLYILV